MSKHNNNYRNYNQYSNNNNKPVTQVSDAVEKEVIDKTEVTETADEVTETEVAQESDAPAETEMETEVEPEVREENNPVIGLVTGCAKLNVRSASNVSADIVCTIDEGSEVEIDETNSTSDFYKVYSAAGFEGYCMKSFITVK